MGKSGETRKDLAAKSLEQHEVALKLTAVEIEKFYMLSDLARIAFEAGEFEKARTYASQLVNKASQYRNDWNHGNALHHGNIVLGRLALKSGDLNKAKEYLIEAGTTPGSPQLDSFGPDMTLAKELLEKGEKEIVIKYFQLCSKFWEMGRDDLEDWTSTAKAGGIPDFGGNLAR